MVDAKDENEARRIKGQRETAVKQNAYAAPSRITVGQLLDEYAAMRTDTEPAHSSTSRNIRFAVQAWQPLIGKRHLQKLTMDHVNAAVKSMLEKPLATKTVHDYLMWLRAAMDWAGRRKLVYGNVARDATTPTVRHEEMKFWTLEQLGVFLVEARRRDDNGDWVWGSGGRMLAVGALTGLRVESEWGGMPRRNVDLKAMTANLTQVQLWKEARDGEKGRWVLEPIQPGSTKGKRRLVQLKKSAQPFLQAQEEWLVSMQRAMGATTWNPHRLFFCDYRGEIMPTTSLRRTFYDMTAAAGLPRIRVHDLRHTYATIRLMLGDPVVAVSQALGHSSVKMTLDTYAHFIPGLEEAAGDRLTAALDEVMRDAR